MESSHRLVKYELITGELALQAVTRLPWVVAWIVQSRACEPAQMASGRF